MKKIKSIIIALLVLVIGSFNLNAQSLDDISKKVYETAVEAIHKGMNRQSAYEEYLEKQELEAAKKAEEERKAEEDEYWEAIDILRRCVFCDPVNKNIIVKRYCHPIEDFVWYRAFIGTDDKIWVNLFYDDNGEIGEMFYASTLQKVEYTSTTESLTGIKTPALKVTFTSGDLLFIQDTFDPYQFSIAW